MDKKLMSKLYKEHQAFVAKVTEKPRSVVKTSILRDDPMSPYRYPESKLIFDSITDEINSRSFKAVYPQSYTPIPRYFTDFNITPYFSPGEDMDYAHGAITIAGMIDLVSMKQPWALENVTDFDTIIQITNKYYDLISKTENRSIAEYRQRVERFLRVMEKGRLRAYRRIGKIDVLKSKDLKYFMSDFII